MTGTQLLRGADVLGEGIVDVLLADGLVTEIGPAGRVDGAAEVPNVDAASLVLLPGLVDLHTPLRDPGANHADDLETGGAAPPDAGR